MQDIVETSAFAPPHRALVHGFSTRALGDLSYKSGLREEVTRRRNDLARAFGFASSQMFTVPLTHSSRVAVVRDRSFLERVNEFGTYVPETPDAVYHSADIPAVYSDEEIEAGSDGVIFNIPEILALIITADCAAVGFHDPLTKSCGLAHVGLLGAVNRLSVQMVLAMGDTFGSRPEDIEVIIFPAIRACHYDLSRSGMWQKIGAEVLAAYGTDSPFFASDHFDLPGFIADQLQSAGIPAPNISDTGLCTACEHDRFYSNVAARTPEAKAREGRFGAVLGRKL